MLIPRSTLRTRVAFRSSLGNTGDGVAYGPAGSLKVSLQRTRKMHRTPTGDVIDTGAVLLLHPADAELLQVKVGDEVAEGPDTWTVDKVAPIVVDGRVHHVEVLVS